ncbi:MAG TPA: MFS transporter [Micromonosporaceae bacterium]|nr:MFS transporter [Micromonosporaceae bacterium]
MATADTSTGLRHNPNWHRLWFGQAVSLIGDFVFNTTVVLWVATVIAAGQSWAPAAVGGVLIAAAAPILLVGPVAGVYVDRWDRRRIMLATDLLRAAFIAVLLVVPLFGTAWPVGLQLTLVYAMVALASAASQFFNPARFAILAATIPPQDRARAFGLTSATASTTAVVGPPLAAPLLFSVGVQWALLVNVASFLASYAAVRLVKVAPEASRMGADKPGFWPELREGLRFFLGNRVLVAIVAAVCVYMFAAGAINVLDVFFVSENLHADPSWLGTLNAAFGVGSIAGALLASRLAAKLGEARVFGYGVALMGLVVAVYSRTTSLPVAIVVLALAGVPLAVVNVMLGPLVLRATPQALLGRVNAVMNPTVYLASILSMAVAGFLASTALHDLHATVGGVTFGRIDTIFGISAVLMIVAGLASLRPLSNRQRADTATPAPAGAPAAAPAPEPAS